MWERGVEEKQSMFCGFHGYLQKAVDACISFLAMESKAGCFMVPLGRQVCAGIEFLLAKAQLRNLDVSDRSTSSQHQEDISWS